MNKKQRNNIDRLRKAQKGNSQDVCNLLDIIEDLEKERDDAFNKGMNNGLIIAAKEACEGCKKDWPVELINDEEMHLQPDGQHYECKGWWRYGDI